MFGISWGGFNSLQVAALRPPALKAIISVCSTDDRYADDVHYMGGCVLASDMLWWSTSMLAFNARPPDPRVVRDRWRQMWRRRLEENQPWTTHWLSHQWRDDYWKQGSVCEDYRAIDCPVYMVGGWADPYHSSILRVLEDYPGPRKGLIGPWMHRFPEEGVPGPAIGFLQEALRWWDYWLKGMETGIMAEPMLQLWLQESFEPTPSEGEWYAWDPDGREGPQRPGRWVSETSWPPATARSQRFYFDRDRLDVSRGAPMDVRFGGTLLCGQDAGASCAYRNLADLPPDQRLEDGASLCFTTEPLRERLEILGFPVVRLRLAADQPNALVIARLCSVSDTGASTLITRGALNLTHRHGYHVPAPLVSDEFTTVEIALNAIGYAVPPGHRLRLAISPTYWPWLWPSPKMATLTVKTEDCHLDVPLRSWNNREEIVAFLEAEWTEPVATQVLRRGSQGREMFRDVGRGLVTTVYVEDFDKKRLHAGGLEFGGIQRNTFSIATYDPLSAQAQTEWEIEIGRNEWRTRLEVDGIMWSSSERFFVSNSVIAYETGRPVFERSWNHEFARQLV